MIANPLLALRNLVTQDSRTVGVLDDTINRAFAPLLDVFGGSQDPAAPQPLGTARPGDVSPQPLGTARPGDADMLVPASQPFNIDFAMGPRRPNPPAPQVTDALGNLASSVLGEGATVRVTSGMGEYGSPRHRGGLAADVQFIDPQGNPITLSDERARALALAAPSFGITGFGAGEEYMGDRTFHMDMFPPDQYTEGMGHTWGSFGAGVSSEFRAALSETDDLYRDVGSALGVTVSTSNPTARERGNVEAELGAILNEVYDPERADTDERRNRTADVLTGLGVGFGQMSRGDRVDLSGVRDAAERRRNQNIQLRMERARRSAGANYAMELGDEGMARAIAGGAADVNTLLTARQQDIVNRRADEAIVRQAQQAGYLADALQGVLPEQMVEAIRGGADPTSIMRANELARAAEAAAQTQQRIDDQISFIQQLQEDFGTNARARAEVLGEELPEIDPIMQRALMLAEMDGYANIQSGGSLADYMAEARLQVGALTERTGGGFTLSPGQQRFDAAGNPIAAVPDAPAGDPGQVLAAQNILANPDSTPDQRNAAQIVLDTGGATTLPQAVDALTAGAPSPDESARAQRIDTMQAAFMDRGVAPDAARELAAGLADGRYREQAHPVTGELAVYDRAALLTGQDPQSAQVFPPPPGPSDYNPPPIMNPDLDYAQAFGPAGVALNALNNLGEALGLGVLDPNNREAVQTVRRLATAGRIAAAIEVGGRPSAYLLEMYQDLETNPAQLFTGPDTARIRLENQRAATVRELRELDELLAPDSPIDPATRSQAYQRRLATLPLLTDLDAVLNGLAAAPAEPPGASELPDAVRQNDRAMAALNSRAESLGLSPEEIWQFLSEDARRRLIGEGE
jgi:putative intracellular protease/amidase